MSLADAQQLMSRFLYTRAPNTELSAELIGELDSGGPVAPELGLRVYRANLLGAVGEELATSFPRTRGLVGARQFDALARSYLFDPRGSSRRIGELGAGFVEHLRVCASREAADLAELEWAQEEAFFAADDEPLREAGLSSLLERAADTLRLRLRRSIRLLTPHYPVHREAWDGPGEDLQLVVWRERGLHRVDEVEPELRGVLGAIAAGKTLAEIAALPEIVATPERLGECLGLLLSREWLAETDS